jgi:DNA-binding NtrC family response regulator
MIHVLVVDDDDLVRRAMGRALRRDLTITESPSIEDAKRLLVAEDCTIDVIVSDLMMPNGTGLDLYLWVKENRPTLADRFMICSGGGPSGVMDGVTKHSIPFFTKPVDVQEIRDAVQKLVTSEPRGPADPT